MALTLDHLSNQHGSATITVRATDGAGAFVEDSFDLTVTPVNDAPHVAAPTADVSIDEDSADLVIDLSGVFADVDSLSGAETVTLSVTGNTSASLVSATLSGSSLTLAALGNQNGSATITIRATDAGGASVQDSFQVTVAAVNDAPSVQSPIGSVTVDEDAPDTALSLAAVFADIDVATNADAIVISVSGNTNPDLLSATLSGSDLTLDYHANAMVRPPSRSGERTSPGHLQRRASRSR
jgi:hypothetical protein